MDYDYQYAASAIIFVSFIWLCSLIIFPATSHRSLPPGPRPLPLVGNILQVRSKPHRALAELARLHGPVMSLKLGTVTSVVISSTAAAREVLHKHDHVMSGRAFPDTARALDHIMSSFIWRSASAKWKLIRRLCSEQMFSPQKLDSAKHMRRQKLDELLHYLGQCSAQGRSVYIGQVVFTTALNILSNMLFSVDLVSYDDEIRSNKFKKIMWGMVKAAVAPNISDFFPALGFLDLQGVRRRAAALFREFYQLFDGIILDRSRTRALSAAVGGGSNCPPNNKDLLDSLLDLRDSSELTIEEINSFFMDIIVAGIETTHVIIEWAMAELLKNPEKMAKARSELKLVLKSGSPMQESDIPNLPYLEAVIKETWRLHGSFLIPHKAEAEVEVCGFKLPKDTRVLVNAGAIWRDPDLWENPTRFKPERFLDHRKSDSKTITDFDFLLFGAGRRMCPGMPLARRTVPLLLGSLLHSFEWKLVDGETPESLDMDEDVGLLLSRANPLIALPIKL